MFTFKSKKYKPKARNNVKNDINIPPFKLKSVDSKDNLEKIVRINVKIQGSIKRFNTCLRPILKLIIQAVPIKVTRDTITASNNIVITSEFREVKKRFEDLKNT